MNQADKELFETPSKINEELIEIQAEIFRVDGHSLTGRLKVLGTLDNDIIIGAEYSYDLENPRDVWRCAQAILKPTLITVRKEISFNPRTLDMAVSRFKVVSIDKIQD